jgi:hypothetical protein
MKCLSVRNPWSYLICSGLKDVENRTWKTNFRGEILIHSSGDELFEPISPEHFSKNLEIFEKCLPLHAEFYKFTENKIKQSDCKILKFCTETKKIELLDKKYQLEYSLFKKNSLEPMEKQAIIGSVEIVDCVENSKSPWAENGNYHWILKNAKMLDKPILFVKGKLGLFEYAL